MQGLNSGFIDTYNATKAKEFTMTLNDLVVFHDRDTNLEDATRELAKIIGVKLSKAKEHHAKALGQNSYNGLLAHLSEYGEISINLSKYVDALSSVYGSTHKRELSTESIRQIAYSSFIVTLRAIYDRVTFSDFIRYALIESEQSVPLIAWGEIEASLTEKYDSLTYKEGIDNATYELHKFLLLNEVSDDLKKYISVSLREIRDVMSSVSRGEYRNSRFSLVELLCSYKKDIATYLTPKVYKVYLLPLVRLDKSPRSFYEMDDRELEPSELMVKAAEMNLMVSELHWGARFETLDRFMQPVNVKFGFPPYEGGFTFPESIVSSPEGRLLPAYKEPSGRYTLSESMVSEHAVYIGFGERFDANNPETFEHLVCQFYPDYAEGRVDFGAGGLCRRSEIYVQVLVKKGEVLPKYALTELSSHLWKLMGLKGNENYILGKFTPIEFNGGVSIPSVIGKVISPVLKENPDHYAALINLEYGMLYVADSKRVYSPYATNIHALSKATSFDLSGLFSGRHTPNDNIYDLVKETGLKQKFAHSVINNFKKIAALVPEVTIIDRASEVVQVLPFHDCRNVYVNFYMPDVILIAGYNDVGIQVVNATLCPYDLVDQDESPLRVKLISAIRKVVSGYVYEFELAESAHIDEDCPMFDSLLGETEFADYYIEGSLYVGDVDKSNDFVEKSLGAVTLISVLIKCPKSISAEQLNRTLKEKLPVIEGQHKGNWHRNILVGSLLQEPPFFAQQDDDYDWYQGYSTERPAYSHKPVLDCSVKGVDVHIYGLTSAYTVRHFSDVNTMVEWSDDFEDGLEYISDMIVSRLLVSWFALDERFEALIDLPEKLPDGAIRVNEIADRLNQLDIQELVAFYKQANKD